MKHHTHALMWDASVVLETAKVLREFLALPEWLVFVPFSLLSLFSVFSFDAS